MEGKVAGQLKKRRRDTTKGYSVKQFSAKLRRLADAIDQGKSFSIQIAGERVTIPAGAFVSVEHERAGGEDEVEFQLRWKRA